MQAFNDLVFFFFSLIIWPQSLRMKLENQAPYRGGGQGSILDTRCRLCIVARVRLKQAAECSRDHSIILQQIFIGCLLGTAPSGPWEVSDGKDD